MKHVKALAAFAAISSAVSLCACGSGSNQAAGGTDEARNYTFWLYNTVDASYYLDYNENPALQYALSHWSEEGTDVAFEFWVPPAGSAADNYSTMISTGELPDIMDGSVADSGEKMCEEGLVIELTDYINEYMPNYKTFLEEHPSVKEQVCYYDEDGGEHYYDIAAVSDTTGPGWCGYEYRRDWIVKYGVNPQTGEAFTGGYTEDAKNLDTWVDDVVFPSGNTDPVYISDWEWMFGIFEKAYEDLGLEDSYCMSIYYNVITPFAQITAGFGGGGGSFYRTPDGECVFGAVTEAFRAYLECMNVWYEKGWLDPYFAERSADMFYAIDDANVRTGKIGMWYGVVGTLGNGLDTGDAYTLDSCVFACDAPINDVYGTEEAKFIEPFTNYGGGLVGNSYFITQNAVDNGKDIGTLCRFLDYLYGEEGARLKSFGLSKEQQEEQGNELMVQHGLENGSYYITEEGKFCFAKPILDDSGYLKSAVIIEKFPGLTLYKDQISGYGEQYDHLVGLWTQHENIGNFMGRLTGRLSEEDSQECSKIINYISDYAAKNLPAFIKGEKDITDDDVWEDWCKVLAKYNIDNATQIYQSLFNRN